MPNNPAESPRPLPERPNLRHLKDEAKALMKVGAASSLSRAQFGIARQYGFAAGPGSRLILIPLKRQRAK